MNWRISISLVLFLSVSNNYLYSKQQNTNESELLCQHIELEELTCIDDYFEYNYIIPWINNIPLCFNEKVYVLSCFRNAQSDNCFISIDKYDSIFCDTINMHLKYYYKCKGKTFILYDDYYPNWIFDKTNRTSTIPLKDGLIWTDCQCTQIIVFCGRIMNSTGEPECYYQTISDCR